MPFLSWGNPGGYTFFAKLLKTSGKDSGCKRVAQALVSLPSHHSWCLSPALRSPSARMPAPLADLSAHEQGSDFDAYLEKGTGLACHGPTFSLTPT